MLIFFYKHDDTTRGCNMQSTIPGQKNITRKAVEDSKGQIPQVGEFATLTGFTVK